MLTFVNIIDKMHLKPDFWRVLRAHVSIKLNKVHTDSLTGIFASNNRIIHVMYLIFMLEINFGDKILEILIIDVFQIVELELYEVNFKR